MDPARDPHRARLERAYDRILLRLLGVLIAALFVLGLVLAWALRRMAEALRAMWG
jgi:hypothetical protein